MTDKNPLAHYSGLLTEAVHESAAEQTPVSGQSRFHGQKWAECSVEHVAMVLAAPHEWRGYEVRYLYAAPAAAAAVAPDMKWRELLWSVARALNCLPSTSVDANAHVYLQAEKYAAIAAQSTAAAAPVVLPKPDGFLESHPFGSIYHRGKPSQMQMICGACPPMYEASTVRALLAGVSAPAAQAVEPRYTWTGTEADDAMLLLGRMDDSLEPERIAQLEQIVPRLGARINALTAELAAPQAQADAQDAERLDYLETWGATVEVGATSDGGKMFRIGGLRSSESKSLRAAIDTAQAAKTQPCSRHKGVIDGKA